jgi:hypothetical protein
MKPVCLSMAGALPMVPCSAAGLPDEPLARHPSLFHEVAGDQRRVERVVRHVHPAVNKDDRDLRLLDLLEHLVPPGLHDRGEHDVVDFLRHEGLDRTDLGGLLALGIGELEIDAPLLGLVLDALGLGGAPRRLRTDLREPDHGLPGRGFLSRDRSERECRGCHGGHG